MANNSNAIAMPQNTNINLTVNGNGGPDGDMVV